MFRSPYEEFPTITAILTLPGLAERGQGARVIHAGIVIDNSDIAWGTCEISSADDHPDFPSPLLVEEGISAIEKHAVPLLVGQELTDLRPLDTTIESIRETVTIERPIPQIPKESSGISRRAIITGFLSAAEEEASTAAVERITIKRPLHPALRHGLSQALLSAVSKVRNLTMAEIICEEFDSPIPTTGVPLQMPIRSGQSLFLHDQVAALAYTIRGNDPEDSLGPNGERIQLFVRQLKERLVKTGQQDQVTIHLDAQGTLGKLYDNDTGKILGALYGLEQAAAPCPIRVQDPLIMDDQDAQIKTLGQLRDYLRLRGMSLQIVAGAGIDSSAAVQSFVDAGCAHMLHLVMPRLGTIQELLTATQISREASLGILVEGTPSAVSSQVALATQPDVLTHPVDWPSDTGVTIYQNEMARTLAWIAHKN